MSATGTMMDKKAWMKWIISLALGGIFLLIPEQGVYTYNVKMFFTITVICLALVAFEVLSELAVGVLLPSLYCFFNVAPADVVFAPWLDTTMMLLVGSFFMATSLEECGLLRRVACWIMCKAKGNYIMILMAMYLTGVVLNLMTTGRGYLIIGALAFGLCVTLNALGTRVGAAVAVSAMIGACSSHMFTYAATNWAVIKSMGAEYLSDDAVTPFSLIVHNWPMFFVCGLMVFIIGKWYKPDQPIPEVSFFQDQLEKMGKITRREKWNIVMMACILVYIFTTGIHGLNINYAFCVLPWMVYLPFINAADASTLRKVNLKPVIFAAGCMGIGTVADSLGLGDVLVNLLSTLTSGGSNPFLLFLVVFIIVFGLNFLMTPLAVFSLITAPVLALATSLGHDPVPYAYMISSLSEAIILPYEYIPYLIIYGFSMIKMKDFIILNAFRSVMIFLGFLVIMIPYWMLIGLI